MRLGETLSSAASSTKDLTLRHPPLSPAQSDKKPPTNNPSFGRVD
jgi:hypothetical protein